MQNKESSISKILFWKLCTLEPYRLTFKALLTSRSEARIY